jgi:hypothetical protein
VPDEFTRGGENRHSAESHPGKRDGPADGGQDRPSDQQALVDVDAVRLNLIGGHVLTVASDRQAGQERV